jgi:REP element-mobilizing transposase RayT
MSDTFYGCLRTENFQHVELLSAHDENSYMRTTFKRHRERKSIRLAGRDYSRDGRYFVTTCIKGRPKLFGDVCDGQMVLNDIGRIASEQLVWLTVRYPYVQVPVYVVMPDHIHAIICIDRSLIGNDVPCKIKPLTELMGAYKTTSSKRIHLLGTTTFCWQHSFHDRIIRNDREYHRKASYIRNNPSAWEKKINQKRPH